MNERVRASLTIGLVVVGCSDDELVLGWNAAPAAADASRVDARVEAGHVDAGTVDAGGTLAPASCRASGAGRTNCGDGSESCCASLAVKGGTFYRTFSNSGTGATGEADPATVSSFRLDKFLVTVGRFREFVGAWKGGAGYVPAPGSGKHTHLNGGKGLTATAGGYEPGWVGTDDAYVAPTDVSLACTGPLVPDLDVGTTYFTWTPTAGDQENLPINCVNWYEAYAFCIWDGGFLPSDAEEGYAAAGGSAQREYPWGNPAGSSTTNPGTANEYAIYFCYYPSGAGTCTGVASLAPVGTAPRGAGLWGQEDLAGELWEWNLDGYAPYVDRGGDFNTGASEMLSSHRHYDHPGDQATYAYGIRCARAP
jgi:formylglycine-generating enzyme required for sulfatase activity